MTNWKERGDGEYTRVVHCGAVAKVIQQRLLWRAAIDDQMVDDVFFDALQGMQAIDAWADGKGDLTVHPVDRRWQGDEHNGYTRRSENGELRVTQSSCGKWKINAVPERCFHCAGTAQRHADERLP